MIDITRNVKVTVSLSAFDMGQEFAAMNSEEQAQFFNGVATGVKSYGKPSCFQWQMMRDNMEAMPEALLIFQEMAEYGPDYIRTQ